MGKNEIKKTPFVEAGILKEEFGLPRIFIKDESQNPFGTIKDRRSAYILKEANRLKVDKLVLITSGNSGYSLARFARDSVVKVVVVISKTIPDEMKNRLKKTAYQVIELNLDHKILRPEELIAFGREREDETVWEVTNGYEESYIPILAEIISEKVKPDYLVVPLGSGGIFIGMAEAIERYGLRTKVIGIGPQNTFHSLADKLSTPWTPYAKAIQNYQRRGHSVYRLTEEEIKNAFKKYKNTMDCEYSSSVVCMAPFVHHFKKSDTIVLLNSGRLKY